MSGRRTWLNLINRAVFHRRPAEAEPYKSKRAFTISGVYYAASDSEDLNILDALATIVCATGGTVHSRPAPPEDDEREQS